MVQSTHKEQCVFTLEHTCQVQQERELGLGSPEKGPSEGGLPEKASWRCCAQGQSLNVDSLWLKEGGLKDHLQGLLMAGTSDGTGCPQEGRRAW